VKYYAVKKGRHPGIYTSWDACKAEVEGFSGAAYKSFKTEKEARAWIKGPKPVRMDHGLIAYVDGSFNIKTKVYGYGAVLIDGGQVIQRLSGSDDDEELASMRNVAGEINGAMAAVDYAITHGYDGIVLYYDYMGICQWATGEWKANKAGTKAYADYMQKAMKKIGIWFEKVEAHSGDRFNDEADALAKKAVGV